MKRFKELNDGDSVYRIIDNEDENFPIKEYKINKKVEYWNAIRLFLYEAKDINIFDGMNPNSIFTGKKMFEISPKYKDDILDIYVKKGLYSDHLYFTDINHASKKQKQLQDGNCFLFCGKGDAVYFVFDKKELIKKEIKSVGNNDFDGVVFTFEDGGEMTLYDSLYSTEACEGNDYHFYCIGLFDKLSKIGSYNYKAFMYEKDAIKYIEQAKKDEIKKYSNSLKNYRGKPISLKDLYGKELHYGDTVVYTVSHKYGGAPIIGLGEVTGEINDKIRIVTDKNEKKVIRRESIILFKEVKVEEGKFKYIASK